MSLPVFGEGGRAQRGRVGSFFGTAAPSDAHPAALRASTLPEDGRRRGGIRNHIPNSLPRVAARDGGARGGVEAPGRDQMLDRVVIGHVVRIVGAHHHMVGPEGRDQRGKLLRREHHGVEIDLPEIARRRFRQAALRIAARPPGVVDAARIGAEKAAAMDRDDLQVGMAFEHAVEDEVVQRDRGLERIADDVVEIEAAETLCLREPHRMNEHDGAELLGLLPERRERRFGQFLAVDVGENLHALELELLHAALELRDGLVAVRHRHGAERREPIRLARHIFADAVIDDARGLDGDVERHRVIALRRRAHDELPVDAHGVEIGEALIVAWS